jgi:hypothetical protein
MKKVVSLQWKGASTPIEFRGEGDTELQAWSDLIDNLSDFRQEMNKELDALKDIAWENYDDIVSMRGGINHD